MMNPLLIALAAASAAAHPAPAHNLPVHELLVAARETCPRGPDSAAMASAGHSARFTEHDISVMMALCEMYMTGRVDQLDGKPFHFGKGS